MVDGVTSRPFSAITLLPFKTQANARTPEEIIANSRKRYARPRWAVEEDINQEVGTVNAKFEAVCSVCGKTTYVPFEPQPGRPIYCRDCLEKIKNGEIQPIKPSGFSAGKQVKKSRTQEDENLRDEINKALG